MIYLIDYRSMHLKRPLSEYTQYSNN